MVGVNLRRIKALKRQITFSQALATVVGTVIGGGVFFKISSITAQAGHPSMSLFVWLLAGILSIASGLTVSEIAAALPVTGGTIKYIYYTYGRVWGFLFGWAQMLIYYPANIGALSVVFAQQFVALFGWSSNKVTWVALGLACFIVLSNFLGTKFAGTVQAFVTVLKFIPLLLIVIWGLFNSHKIGVPVFPLQAGPHKSFWQALSSSLLSALFAYDGWISVTNIAGEVKSPEKNLSRAIIVGLTIITIIYILVNYTFMTVLPFKEIMGNQNTAFYASMKLFGKIGGKIVTVGILISVYGAINGFTLAGIRVPYILAKAGDLPFSGHIGQTNVNTGVPTISALIILGNSLVMILLGTFDLLTDMLVFVMWGFTTLVSIAVIILRLREPKLNRPYIVPWYPIVPVISIGGGLFIVIATLINQPVLSLIGIGLTMLGLPVYYIMQKRK
jgi:APA family basic amino acid/polyamine antiporter